MRFTLAPTLEEHMDALQQSGWNIGDTAIDGLWTVYCTKAGQVLHASHTDRATAWVKAVEQARLAIRVPHSMN